MRILKLSLEIIDSQKLELPTDAQFLKVAEKNHKLFMWFVTPELYTAKRIVDIRIIGTGHLIDNEEFESLDYLDTVVMSHGAVWHVFEYVENREDDEQVIQDRA